MDNKMIVWDSFPAFQLVLWFLWQQSNPKAAIITKFRPRSRPSRLSGPLRPLKLQIADTLHARLHEAEAY